MSDMVDTHAHLDDPDLPADVGSVLDRARAAGVVQVVAVATSAASSDRVLAIAREHAGVFAAVGIQPNYVAQAEPGDWDRVIGYVNQPKVVALGETGLDRYWDRTPFPIQQDYFERHLELAQEHRLPVVIHCRNAERDVVAQLTRRGGPVRGVMHSFTGTWDDAQEFLALGLHISFAGMITFKNKGLDPLREVAVRVPLDRLLVETDSPYLSPHPHRGRPNEPAQVVVTAQLLAKLRGVYPEELAQATTANARRLFALPDEQLR